MMPVNTHPSNAFAGLKPADQKVINEKCHDLHPSYQNLKKVLLKLPPGHAPEVENMIRTNDISGMEKFTTGHNRIQFRNDVILKACYGLGVCLTLACATWSMSYVLIAGLFMVMKSLWSSGSYLVFGFSVVMAVGAALLLYTNLLRTPFLWLLKVFGYLYEQAGIFFHDVFGSVSEMVKSRLNIPELPPCVSTFAGEICDLMKLFSELGGALKVGKLLIIGVTLLIALNGSHVFVDNATAMAILPKEFDYLPSVVNQRIRVQPKPTVHQGLPLEDDYHVKALFVQEQARKKAAATEPDWFTGSFLWYTNLASEVLVTYAAKIGTAYLWNHVHNGGNARLGMAVQGLAAAVSGIGAYFMTDDQNITVSGAVIIVFSGFTYHIIGELFSWFVKPAFARGNPVEKAAIARNNIHTGARA